MSFIKNIKGYCTIQRWTLGFIWGNLADIVAGKPIEIHYIKHSYKDRWFADPFVLDYDENAIRVLVEEYLDSKHLGIITRLTIDCKTWQLTKREPVLELDSHLSFPVIDRRSNGNVYIYPENAKGVGLGLYEYDVQTNGCKFVEQISGEPLADAVITDLFGERLMFSTHIPTHNGNTLSVHQFTEGKPQLLTEHNFSGNIARNAGDWFKVGDKVYRPAQDCNHTYGGAVILQEVQRRGEKEFAFKDVRRIETTSKIYTTGCHTFNHYDGLTVIDVHGYRHNTAAAIYNAARRLAK